MPLSGSLLLSTIVLWLAACIPIAVIGKNLKHTYPAGILLLGGMSLLVAAFLGWGLDFTWTAPPPMYFAVAPLSIRLDPLSSIFSGLLAVLTISVSLFSPGYLQHLTAKMNPGCYWVQLYLFVIGMLGVIVAANALSFLVFWEIMAIASLFLIATDLSSHESRKAAFIYLAATRIATSLLMSGFLWMYSLYHTWHLAEWHFTAASTIAPALLILIGLCIKGGIWPFHGWLPYAHPAAPSPVSALMSGVMIKVALYAIIRILVMNGVDSPFLIYLMLVLGIISAFWGVLCALMQKDLKSLLAYSSIENVGLILTGISLALLGQSLHLPLVAAISLAAAIFHCVNHGLFKSLMFLGAGAIGCRAHSLDLEQLGGLGKRMPWTMLFFITGGAAICALPPLNGFSSEWLIYQSLFRLIYQSNSLWLGGLAVAAIAILGLIGGTTMYCFAKAIGIAFLGRARTHQAEQAGEVTALMLAAQALLAVCCLFLGLAAPLALTAIEPICTTATGARIDVASSYTIPMALFAAIGATLTAAIYRLWLTGGKNRIRPYITWECGFGDLTQRMQGTATSFSENVAYTFAPLFEYNPHSIIVGRDRRHFPESISWEGQVTQLLEMRLYIPAVRCIRWLGERMLMLQTGSIHLYLGYMLITLVGLMVIGILI